MQPIERSIGFSRLTDRQGGPGVHSMLPIERSFGFGRLTDRRGGPGVYPCKVEIGRQQADEKFRNSIALGHFDGRNSTRIEVWLDVHQKVANDLHFNRLRWRNKVSESIGLCLMNILLCCIANLAHGCRIVSKDKTVYWIWLEDNFHSLMCIRIPASYFISSYRIRTINTFKIINSLLFC